jgi:hypothetical protein
MSFFRKKNWKKKKKTQVISGLSSFVIPTQAVVDGDFLFRQAWELPARDP